MREPATPPRGVRRFDDSLFLACALAWGASVIHVQTAIAHVREFVLFSVFFALLAAAQLAWGIALYRSASRRLMVVGAVGSVMVATLWVVSRTSGLPIGPVPWIPERVGTLDSIASADEAALALLMIFQLRPLRAGRLARSFKAVVSGAGAGLVLLSSLSLTLTRHVH
jgi:hypothetical protein